MSTHKLAEGLAGLGRNGDSMLMHVTPHEVAGLQSLAKSQGTSLTTNPHTGLPEAFSLGNFFTSFLPMAAGMAFGGPTGAAMMQGIAAGAATGAGVSALKGEDPLMGGLMGGMGGYGGGQIGGSLSSFGGAPATTPVQATTAQLTPDQINALNPGAADISASINASNPTQVFNPTATTEFSTATQGGYFPGKNINEQTLGGQSQIMGTSNYYGGAQSPLDNAMAAQTAAPNYLAQGAQRAFDDPSAYIDSIGGNMAAAKMYGLPIAGAALSGLEASDIYGEPITAPKKKIPTLNLSDASYPSMNLNTNYAEGGITDLYESKDGTAAQNTLMEGYGLDRLNRMAQGGMAYADGGPIAFAEGGLQDGGFVVPADVVSHLGNGSTDAGLRHLTTRMSARPIKGKGDGQSDSIPTSIEGKQPARVADGEAYIPPEVVKRKGGAKQFYAMMDKVRKDRTGSKKQGKQINPGKYLPA